MTISMETNAHGAAATTLMPAPWSSGVASRIWSAIHRAPQEAKETPSSLSASVSCRRLSCQNTTATAMNSREPGMIAEMENMLAALAAAHNPKRSEEHTSELQSRLHLVCRLLLEKKKH